MPGILKISNPDKDSRWDKRLQDTPFPPTLLVGPEIVNT